MIHVEGLVWWFVWERKTLNTKNNRNSAWSTPVFTSFPSLQMLLAIGTSKAFCSPEESPHLSCGKKNRFQLCGQVPFGMQVVMFVVCGGQ